MNYDEAMYKIFYSKLMKNLHAKAAPVQGYTDAGTFARDCQNLSNMVAAVNGLDADYCSVLSLSQFLGLPPYGAEGKIAIEEVLGKKYNQSNINIKKLEEITGEKADQKFIDDMRDLMEYLETSERNDDSNLSEEARCVAFVREGLESYGLLTREERIKMGEAILKTTMAADIEKGEDGHLQKSSWQLKIARVVKGRKRPIDLEKVNKIKEKFETIMLKAVPDEQNVIDKMLGE